MIDLFKFKFEKKGYGILANFLSQEEHDHYIGVCDHILNHRHAPQYEWAYNPNGTICKMHGACETVPAFHDLASHPRLIREARNLLPFEDEMDIYISKFFPMEPNATSTLMHQDNYYFNSDRSRVISCAVYLQDTTKENGCLRVVESSHKVGIFPHTLDHSDGMATWIDENQLKDYKIIDLNFSAPYAVFFDINLVHGCYINNSNSTRYSLAWEYINRSEKSLVNSPDKWCDRTPII